MTDEPKPIEEDKQIPAYLVIAILLVAFAIFYFIKIKVDPLEEERQRNLSEEYLKNLSVNNNNLNITGLNISDEKWEEINQMWANISNQTNSSDIQIPFYQRLILLVKYDKAECPNLSLKLDGEDTIRPVEQVINISTEVNFIKLGWYNTNDDTRKVSFTWVNKEQCIPDTYLMTNNEFIVMLTELGVEMETKTNTTEQIIEPTEAPALKRNI